MVRQRISSGSTFEDQAAYSRAVVCGDDVFVSGTTGFDYKSMTLAEGVVAQCRQTFDDIEAVLQQAGASLQDIARITYILPDTTDFEKCWPVLRERLSDIGPAATMFAAALVDARMKIEIEVTARKRR
ncbi:MAG: enamine deaminase RidA (YjgF/YER057c/UK114 family) [Planctomycetota bacterium]|jgi:enamine deaminase RidA (YjgF/YER057c/UK114 family)